MSAELITKYFNSGQLNDIITLYEVTRDQRDRAEQNNLAYLHEIKKLHQAFNNITEPHTGRKVSEPRNIDTPVRTMEAQPSRPVRTMNTPKPPKSKEILDLDLDFEEN